MSREKIQTIHKANRVGASKSLGHAILKDMAQMTLLHKGSLKSAHYAESHGMGRYNQKQVVSQIILTL